LFIQLDLYTMYILFKSHMYLCLLSRFNQHMKGVTCGTGTAYPCKHTSSPPVFSGIHVARSLVFCVIFCSSLSFFFWPLYCPSFFDFLLITPLVSAHFLMVYRKMLHFHWTSNPIYQAMYLILGPEI
jgi:hypothetical protein